MKRIPLGRGKFALVDDEDFEKFYEIRWYSLWRTDNKGSYAVRRELTGKRGGGATHLMHIDIMQPPPGFEVDHRDGDGLNNQRSNLRVATHEENLRNRQGPNANSISGIRGARWRGPTRGWQARIHHQGRDLSFGSYDTAQEASEAARIGAIKHFGEFAGSFDIPPKVNLAALPVRSKRRTKTGFKGVYWNPKGLKHYRATLWTGNRNVYVGDFSTGEEAAEALRKRRLELSDRTPAQSAPPHEDRAE